MNKLNKVFDFEVLNEIYSAVTNSESNVCKLVSDQFGIWSCRGLENGCTNDIIWGSNPYLKSEGNLLCTAARHGGLIDPKKGGLFRRYDVGKVSAL